MYAYEDVYAPYIERSQGQVFMGIREELPGVDDHFVDCVLMEKIK